MVYLFDEKVVSIRRIDTIERLIYIISGIILKKIRRFIPVLVYYLEILLIFVPVKV